MPGTFCSLAKAARSFVSFTVVFQFRVHKKKKITGKSYDKMFCENVGASAQEAQYAA